MTRNIPRPANWLAGDERDYVSLRNATEPRGLDYAGSVLSTFSGGQVRGYQYDNDPRQPRGHSINEAGENTCQPKEQTSGPRSKDRAGRKARADAKGCRRDARDALNPSDRGGGMAEPNDKAPLGSARRGYPKCRGISFNGGSLSLTGTNGSLTRRERRQMNRAEYVSYMQSDAWSRRRDRYYAKHPRMCLVCNAKPPEVIELHHLSYEHVYDEPDSELMPLCQRCHAVVHQLHSLLGGSLADATRSCVSTSRSGRRRRRRRVPVVVGRHDPNAAIFAAIQDRQRAEGTPALGRRAAVERLRAVERFKREHGFA